MLIRYKKSMEKIAMGLLSFMPDVKEVKKLQQTIQEYNNNPNWHLFLWKDEDDILGALGVVIDEDKAIVQHISVDPSHRGNGIGKQMVCELRNMYSPMHQVTATDETKNFLEKCETEA
ncbi:MULTISPECIES: GNAT family N-acetyltransferase [Bacillaceae]|jgi:riboflavin biosynthesis RibT protein|uniref:N-acetyltransferase n=1 Tax=Terribacillus saccharophilus TaxID=361277 RepID=A0A268HG40_9BACI|nr:MULTISPECIES: GNAT family N-acetyltransferase [Bacillaceae]PAD36811.1 N-acetyltransferase [Terribacillus saccharophilus]PAD97794.1 N-acetyltransferase [Terribacillus saccharophilus]PAE01176.1 N-acetyltransferase [Terribacillus saccharophilus]PAE08853.1 N-acetyltransferase [Terribacillus saccharophilus]PAE16869.1 N-acetyltransferase [Virgibacillus sp. 7505]